MKVFVVENYEMGCTVIFELSLETVEFNQFSENDVICNVWDHAELEDNFTEISDRNLLRQWAEV